MSDWLQALLLALIQGVSEFLPVSSSAHLILPSLLFGWQDQGLAFDVAVHAGTLLAVLIYFRHDLVALARSLLPPLRQEGDDPSMVWKLALATLPAVIAGFALGDLIEAQLRGLEVIATTTLLFGLLLAWVSRHSAAPEPPQGETVSWTGALVIGCAQALALIPGTSRSGITITAAMLMGYHPTTAARFSFLLSIPVIAGAMVFMMLGADEVEGGMAAGPTLLAALVAFLSAWATIALFLRLVARIGMMPFAVYRVALAFALFAVLILRG